MQKKEDVIKIALVVITALVVISIVSPNLTGFVIKTKCNDGIDNDNDGYIDYPEDKGCSSILDGERTRCQDKRDNDRDGFIDLADPHCVNIQDDNERGAKCEDGIDNDNDGYIDYPEDKGCSSILDGETSRCQDKVDNDGDGFIDLRDTGCVDNQDDNEKNLINSKNCEVNSLGSIISQPEKEEVFFKQKIKGKTYFYSIGNNNLDSTRGKIIVQNTRHHGKHDQVILEIPDPSYSLGYATYSISIEKGMDLSDAGGGFGTQTAEPIIEISTSFNNAFKLIGQRFNNISSSLKTDNIWLSLNNTNSNIIDVFYENVNNKIQYAGQIPRKNKKRIAIIPKGSYYIDISDLENKFIQVEVTNSKIFQDYETVGSKFGTKCR